MAIAFPYTNPISEGQRYLNQTTKTAGAVAKGDVICLVPGEYAQVWAAADASADGLYQFLLSNGRVINLATSETVTVIPSYQ
jgi:hypothetical protein